jgi:hypothetical protein
MNNVEKALQDFRKYVVQQSRYNLTKGNHNVTKSLYNTVNVEVKKMPNSISIYFDLGDYGAFQDQGVKGANPSLVKNGKQKAPNSPFRFKDKKPPVAPLIKWAKFRGIRFRNEKGQFEKGGYTSIGFWLQKRIYAQGLKPTLFFTKPFRKGLERLPEEMVTAYGLEAEDLLRTILIPKK